MELVPFAASTMALANLPSALEAELSCPTIKTIAIDSRSPVE
jgi:hypothetical protein